MTRADRVRTHLSGEILREVSRSFYLSLRLLPRALRGCVSLGYLLARTSDTIADAPGLGSCERLELLEAMRAVVRGEGEREVFCQRLRNEVAPVVEHRGEAELLLHCDGCLDWLGSLGARQGGHVRGVFEEIIRGQMLDVERFPDASVLRALSTAGELEEYTYLVAGSVGSFWTEVCVDELGENVFAEDRETMIARGVAYGKGLQLVNVLRDVAQDAQLGRCYLPTEELGGEAGLGQRLESGYGEVAECFARWMGCCSERLEHGVGYLEAITPWRLKYATALPLLFAGSTLARLREADWEKRKEGIKISRREVKSVMARAAAAALRRGGIESLYRRLSRG